MKPDRFKIIGILLTAVLGVYASCASAQVPVRFTLDWKFEGQSAPFFLALDRGYYKAEGIDLHIVSGKGSVAGINRVANGEYVLGAADINSLIRYRDRNPDNAVQAVFMYYDTPPFAIASLQTSNITRPRDLEGKVLGAPAADGAFAQWRSFAKENGIDTTQVAVRDVGFAVREPMLAAGRVDAITGFSFSLFQSLRARGVAADRIRIMLMADYGLQLYGNAVIVNPAFAAEFPEIVRGFVRATVRGFVETVADPDAAIEHVLRRNRVAKRDVELHRLKMAIRENIATPWVRRNGIGNVDSFRLQRSIQQIGHSYTFTAKPAPEDVFTDRFLPPASERMLK